MNLQDNEVIRNKVVQYYAYQMMMQNLQQNLTYNKNEGQIPVNSNFSQNIRKYPNQMYNYPVNYENLMRNLSKETIPLIQTNEHSNKILFQDSMGTSSVKSIKSVKRVIL